MVQDAWRAEERLAGAVTGQTRGETAVLPFPAGGVRTVSRGEREWKERDRDRGIFVIRPKFKLQFSKLHFSPSSWPQMKNFLIPFLLSFVRYTTFVSSTFTFEQWFRSYLIT